MGPDHAPLSKRHGATSVTEFRDTRLLPEALTNYLALIGWSPGEGEELLPIDELARAFPARGRGSQRRRVRHRQARVGEPALSEGRRPGARATVGSVSAQRAWVSEPTPADVEFLERIIPVAAASVDRLEQVPARLAFLFDYSADARAGASRRRAARSARARAVIDGAGRGTAFERPLLDRDAFRAAAARVRERTGQKGKALFHPIRLALHRREPKGSSSILLCRRSSGRSLQASGIKPILGAAERATLSRPR